MDQQQQCTELSADVPLVDLQLLHSTDLRSSLAGQHTDRYKVSITRQVINCGAAEWLLGAKRAVSSQRPPNHLAHIWRSRSYD